MAELVLRQVEPAIVEKLKERADKHRRSVEDEHREILREALLVGEEDASTMTFEEYLRKMPDVGTDEDFSRIEGSFRDVGLVE
ncbi:MAG: FitA-like ribbon-helix-helix domain-containing protein [Planctomycetota bacterium]